MEKETSEGKAFYKKLAKQAKEKDTTINVIGIQGDNCGVSILGTCADISRGFVSFVNALEVQRKMREIIRNPIIATDVNVRILLPNGYGLRKYGSVTDERQLDWDVGNVTGDCDLTLEFGPKPSAPTVATTSTASTSSPSTKDGKEKQKVRPTQSFLVPWLNPLWRRALLQRQPRPLPLNLALINKLRSNYK